MKALTLDRLPRSVLARIDLQTAHRVSALILAAERVKLFRRLEERALPASSIRRRTGIHPRFLAPFLDSLVSLGLLKKDKGLYRNSALASDCFVRHRSIHWTEHYSSECLEEFEALGSIEQVMITGRSFREILGRKRPDYLSRMRRDPVRAENFTRMLYDLHQPDARALAAGLDLSGHHRVLDVGGGSGVMALALAKKNPHLAVCVLDIPPVCRVTRKIVRAEGMSRQVKVLDGDISRGLPEGYDVIMLCDVGRIDDRLLERCHERLPRGGLIVLLDLYLSADGTAPLERLLRRFTSTAFPTDTWRQMVDRVRAAGFGRVRGRRILGDLWMITGRRTR